MYSCIMDIKFKKILLVYALQTKVLDLVGNNHMHLQLCQESILYTILYHIFAYVCNFWLTQLRDSFHLKNGMQNRCLITFYVTITQTLITSLIALNCISELYTQMLITPLYSNCMNKNWFSLKRVISQINELVSYNIKLGMLHFDNMNQYRAISLHHMLLFSICFIRCKLSTFLQTKYLTIQRKTRAKKSKVVY